MGIKIYPFIDIAVLDQVRPHFLAGDAIVILTGELDTVIWANGAGAALLGYRDIEQARGAPSNLGYASRRQIAGTPGFPSIGRNRSLLVRVTQKLASHAVGFLASEIVMPDGIEAIMLVAPDFDAEKRSPQDAAARAIYGIAEAGHNAALIDGKGMPLAASGDFAELGLSDDALRDLALDAADEPDRLLKRLVAIGDYGYPVGVARLSDDPTRLLVIVVDDPQPLARPARQLPAEPSLPVEPSPPNPARALPTRPAHVPIAASTDVESDGWFFDDAPARSRTARPTPPAVSALPAGLADPVEPVPGPKAEDAPRDTMAPDPVTTAPSLEPPSAPTDEGVEIVAEEPKTSSAPEAELVAEEDFEPDLELPALPDLLVLPRAIEEPSHDFPEPIDVKVTPPAEPLAAADGSDVDDEAVFQPDLRAGPVRFVWRTDADGRFSVVSEEFARSVGAHAADIVGKSFRELAAAYDLDPDGEIAGLLERRDTWSGRTVMWPIEGTDLKVPVDLAALPVYARDRAFDGFRGFGVVRIGDAVIDEAATGLSLFDRPREATKPVAAANDDRRDQTDPFAGEEPAIEVRRTPDRRQSDKVIKLAEHRAAGERGLSANETSAFREIGERLKQASEKVPDLPPVEPEPVPFPRTPTLEEIEARLRNADRLIRGITHPEELDEGDAGPTEAGPQSVSPTDTDTYIEPEHLIEDEIDEEDLPPGDFPARLEQEDQALPVEERQETSSEEPEDLDALLAEDGGSGDDDLLYPPEMGPVSRSVDTSILERLPVPVLIHTGDNLHFANEEFFSLTGYGSLPELEEAGGLDVLFADSDASDDSDDHRRRLRTRAGEEFPVDALLQSVPWKGGKALLLALKTAPDPAPAGATTEELAELESRVTEMSTILDTATDGIVILGNDGNIRSISRPAEALFGFDTSEVAGKPFFSLFAVESQRAARDYLNGLSDNGVASVLNDGREVIGREAQGRFIPLFMTIGRLPGNKGFCAVLRDITQWKRAEEELTQARTEAERASSQKTEFLARISHEIRTPLNAIIGFSELMIDEKFGPIMNDRYRDYLRDINRSGNHVLDLVNDLLDISKIEAGQQDMSYEAVSLNETLAEAVAMMQPQANRNRVIIRSSYASKLPEVVADQRSIRQIALNLLSNAVRYTQAGGQVIVSTSYEPTGDVVLKVRDTGIGMSQSEIEQALKPFRQINALKRPRGDGTGLGLPLTKAMVEANRARFSIASAPGEGTLVEIVFPSQRVLAG